MQVCDRNETQEKNTNHKNHLHENKMHKMLKNKIYFVLSMRYEGFS